MILHDLDVLDNVLVTVHYYHSQALVWKHTDTK